MKLYGNTGGTRNTAGKKTSVKKKRARRRKALLAFCIVLFVLFLLAAGLFIAKTLFVKPPDVNHEGIGQTTAKEDPQNPGDPSGPSRSGNETPAVVYTRKPDVQTLLIVGTDESRSNTDTIMVAQFDPAGKAFNIVSVPRDTMVNVPWSIKKINSVYGNRGIDGLVEEFRKMLGFKIDHYVIVDFTGFEKLVDTVGGVYFDVPQDMDYEDPAQDLAIHYKAGYQYLSGADAVKIARFRSGYKNADIGRISTQQKLLTAIAKRCVALVNISKVGTYAEIFHDYVDTDLSVGNLLWFGQEFLKMGSEAVSFMTLPANYGDSVNGQSYVTVYVDEWVKMLNESLNPYNEEITADDISVITRNAGGELYVTDGSEISGGKDSFWKNR